MRFTSDQNQPSAALASAERPIRGRKLAAVVALLEGQVGASMGQLEALSGWKPHSVRAALSGLRKAGYVIEGSREGSTHRLYRITGRVEGARVAGAPEGEAAAAAAAAHQATEESRTGNGLNNDAPSDASAEAAGHGEAEPGAKAEAEGADGEGGEAPAATPPGCEGRGAPEDTP